jgi:hypothetical protein
MAQATQRKKVVDLLLARGRQKPQKIDYTFWRILSITFFARLPKIVVDLLLARTRHFFQMIMILI